MLLDGRQNHHETQLGVKVRSRQATSGKGFFRITSYNVCYTKLLRSYTWSRGHALWRSVDGGQNQVSFVVLDGEVAQEVVPGGQRVKVGAAAPFIDEVSYNFV